MRAVVYLWVNLVLLYLVNRYGLWKQMFGDAIIALLWAWIIVGAYWVTRAGPTRRAFPPASPGEADALKRAAQSAAEKLGQRTGEPPL